MATQARPAHATRRFHGFILALVFLLLLMGNGAAQAQPDAQSDASKATAATAATVCNDGQTIALADQTWESASFTMHVINELLVAAYGCRTEIVPGTPAATESALAQNDVQIIAEIWTGRSSIIEDAIAADRVRVVGDTLKGGAEQGWYVPDYVVLGDVDRNIAPMAPDLKTWRDLPQYKELFRDPEVPSKGRFLNCPSGWVCEKTNSRLLQLHGLEEHYNNFRAGTGAALDAAISSAYERGEPILFYYWQPAGLMAKHRFHKIELGPFVPECWETIVGGEGELCASDFLLAHLSVAMSTPFAEANPQIIGFLERLQFEPALLNRMILEMTETRASGTEMAKKFLNEHPEVWRNWMSEDIAMRAAERLGVSLQTQPAGSIVASSPDTSSTAAAETTATTATTTTTATTATIPAPPQQDAHGIFPDWSAAHYVNTRLMKAVQTYGATFRLASEWMLTKVLLPVERAMQAVPAWLFLLAVAALSWHATRSIPAAIAYVVGLYLIGAVGLWDKLMQTFALVLVSTVCSIIIGVPVGILAAGNRWLRRIVTPVLDVMQTMPSFVYLIPVLMLFGLGKVPALFATIVYAVPPLIRLTVLGLRQVDHNVKEAAQSFGVTRWQMLTRVTLPLARPSIMAGVNQTTMMALAMVVVASMIGARGLGEDVLAGIQTLDVGRGLQAGVAIVILAIVIDRITQAYGRPRRLRHAMNEDEP